MIKTNEPVIIDEEFKNLLPSLSEEEKERLKKLCTKDGIEDPLKVWNGILIDGHNRYEISKECGLNYEVKDKTKDLSTRADVINWIIENQGARRNMTKSQLVQAYSKYEEERAKEAEAKMMSGKKDPSSNLNEGTNPIRTAAEVAKKIGVSENTYRDMKTVVKEGTQEQKDRMDKKKSVPGKPNGVSAIRAEINSDKKIVEEYGTDEQKKRLSEGGDGNKPTEIANEIRKENKIVTKGEAKTKVCSKCKREYPIDYFYEGRTQCKYCRDKVKHGQLRDVKGDLIKSTGEYANVTEEQIVGNIYDTKSTPVITVDDVLEEFKANFNIYYANLNRILETNREIIKDSKKEVGKLLDSAISKFEELKGEYA